MKMTFSTKLVTTTVVVLLVVLLLAADGARADFTCKFRCVPEERCLEFGVPVFAEKTICAKGGSGVCCYKNPRCLQVSNNEAMCTDQCHTEKGYKVVKDEHEKQHPLCPGTSVCCLKPKATPPALKPKSPTEWEFVGPQLPKSLQPAQQAQEQDQSTPTPRSRVGKVLKTVRDRLTATKDWLFGSKNDQSGGNENDESSSSSSSSSSSDDSGESAGEDQQPKTATNHPGQSKSTTGGCSAAQRAKLVKLLESHMNRTGMGSRSGKYVERYLGSGYFGINFEKPGRTCTNATDCTNGEYGCTMQARPLDKWSYWMVLPGSKKKPYRCTCSKEEGRSQGRCVLSGVDWCGAFVTYNVQRWVRNEGAKVPFPVLGYKKPNVHLASGWADWGEAQAPEAGIKVRTYNKTSPLDCSTVHPGDVVMVGKGGKVHHVGTAVGKYTDEKRGCVVKTIDGNKSDKVVRTEYANEPHVDTNGYAVVKILHWTKC